MKRIREPHWINHLHLFDSDEYDVLSVGQYIDASLPVVLTAAQFFI